MRSLSTQASVRLFEHEVDRLEISGSALVMVEGEEPEAHCHGRGGREDADATVDDNTLFQIGSMTKLFTAGLVRRCIEDGLFELDSPIGTLLPAGSASADISSITIKQLLTHRSGLPRLPDNFVRFMLRTDDPYRFYGRDALYEYLKRAKVARTTKASYSNLGYGLLGHIVASLLNNSLADTMDARILRPLQMVETFLFGGAEKRKGAYAKGHDAAGKETPYWDLSVMGGAGGLVSSPADMKAFLRHLLHPSGRFPWLDATLAPLAEGMAWGWFKRVEISAPGEECGRLWHNGMTGGFSSHIEIDRRTQRGFCLLMNRALNPGLISQNIAQAFFKE